MPHEHEQAADRLDCPACRASVSTPAAALDHVWTHVSAAAFAPKPRAVERFAARLLRSPGLARALLTTPSLTLAWLVASTAVLAVGVVVSSGGTPLVPLLAPALAGAGIAFAYGPATDPAAELAASMPVGDRVVLLVRAVAVFGVNAGLGVLASLLTPAAAGLTWLWLVPMTAVCAVCLAAATLAGSAAVGVVVGLTGWSITVLGAGIGDGVAAAVSTHPLQLAYLVVTAVCVAVVVVDPPTRKGLPV
jgi:hypothetical protein